jgi:hypothetical protein
MIEKKLQLHASARNLKTVDKLITLSTKISKENKCYATISKLFKNQPLPAISMILMTACQKYLT